MSQEESEYRIPKMDCAAEERLVRAALEGRPEIGALTFDLPERRVRVRHAEGMAEAVLERLEGLGLGAEPIGTRPLPVGAPELTVPDAAAAVWWRSPDPAIRTWSSAPPSACWCSRARCGFCGFEIEPGAASAVEHR